MWETYSYFFLRTLNDQDNLGYWRNDLSGNTRLLVAKKIYGGVTGIDITSRNTVFNDDLRSTQAIYRVLFDRDPGPSDFTYWGNMYTQYGIRGDGNAMIDAIANGATGIDVATMNYVVTVEKYPR